jgi:hypothetical protein
MRGSPLHLYNSVFGGSLVLRGMELPKEEAAWERLPKDESSPGGATVPNYERPSISGPIQSIKMYSCFQYAM